MSITQNHFASGAKSPGPPMRHCPCTYTSLGASLEILMITLGPTIKFHNFPGLERKFLNSMTFQVFHDLYEPCQSVCKWDCHLSVPQNRLNDGNNATALMIFYYPLGRLMTGFKEFSQNQQKSNLLIFIRHTVNTTISSAY